MLRSLEIPKPPPVVRVRARSDLIDLVVRRDWTVAAGARERWRLYLETEIVGEWGEGAAV